MTHKFRIGQAVFFSTRIGNVNRSTFKIVSSLPIENDARVRYQIKSPAEAFARIVEEHDLKPGDAAI